MHALSINCKNRSVLNTIQYIIYNSVINTIHKIFQIQGWIRYMPIQYNNAIIVLYCINPQ